MPDANFVHDVSDLLDKAVKFTEGTYEKKVIECLIKRSPSLRKCVAEDNYKRFRKLLETQTLVLKGDDLEWLIKCSETIETFMEYQSYGGCPKHYFMWCPEETEISDSITREIFTFLKHVEEEKPVGRYMRESDGDILVDFNADLRHLADVFQFLSWRNHKTPQAQLEDLIEHGLLESAHLKPLGHHFPHKEAHIKAGIEKKRIKFEQMLEQIHREVEESSNNDDNDSYNSYINNHVIPVPAPKPKAPKGPHVKVNYHGNKYRAHLPSVKPSKQHASRKYTKRAGKKSRKYTRRH
jgi:hypothetical protein